MTEYIPYTIEEREKFIEEGIAYNEWYIAGLPKKSGIRMLFESIASIFATKVAYTAMLDVSHWQNDAQPNGEIDWQLLWDAGYRCVAIKCTEGYSATNQWVDPYFEQNARGAIEAGFQVVFYHLFRQNLDATRQADALIRNSAKMVEYADGNVRLAGDFETTDGQSQITIIARTKAFLDYIKENHRTPLVYSAPWWWNPNIGEVEWINDFWLWGAHWTSATIPLLPIGWDESRLKVWQFCVCPRYSWCDPCNFNLSGSWDLDRYCGTEEELIEWISVASVPPPPAHDHEEIWVAINDLTAGLESLREVVIGMGEEMISLADLVSVLNSNVGEISGRTEVLENEIEEIGAVVDELETHTHLTGEPQ